MTHTQTYAFGLTLLPSAHTRWVVPKAASLALLFVGPAMIVDLANTAVEFGN